MPTPADAIHWSEYSQFLVTLAAVLDPFTAIPVFLVLTTRQTPAERHRTARMTVLTVGAILVGAALTGETLLTVLGTSLAAFRVGGGIVFLFMGLAMLGAEVSPFRSTPAERTEAATKASVAVVPLGIPLLAGPGALSAVIVETARGHGPRHLLLVIACIGLVTFVCWLALRFAEPVGRAIGPIGMNVANRLLGLLLTAIAVEMMAGGLRTLFPGLA